MIATLLLLAAVPVILALVVYAERRDEKRRLAREERRRELAGPPSWTDGIPHRVIGPLPRGSRVEPQSVWPKGEVREALELLDRQRGREAA